MTSRNYIREHLRAPYRVSVLFADGEHVFTARTKNLSEGGMLVDQLPHLPGTEIVPFVLPLPKFPELKNFSLKKLEDYSADLFENKIIKVEAKMVRREGITTSVDDVFKTKFGIQFIKIEAHDKKMISEYVSVYSGNLIYLQRLIEESNSFQESKDAVRQLARILGYGQDLKMSELRQKVSNDYRSLQWK